MSSPIEEFLRQFKGEEILYIPNPGNAGDSVIATATYQVFDRVGLRYTLPRTLRQDLSNRIVIYGGGGNLVSAGTHSARIAEWAHARAKRFVVLPHTIKSVTPLLQSFGSNVDIICREATSYQYVSTTAPRAAVHLMDDMAFHLDVEQAMAARRELSPVGRVVRYGVAKAFRKTSVPALNDVLRAARLARIRKSLRDRERSEELFCFRTDGEKTNVAIPPLNIDLSETFKFGVESVDAAHLAAGETLRFLSRFNTVHTNRLHMAISGALLGINVMFYPNDYYKCRAVYEQSMKHRFGNVRWIG